MGQTKAWRGAEPKWSVGLFPLASSLLGPGTSSGFGAPASFLWLGGGDQISLGVCPAEGALDQ